jgi:hypothetical protein
MLVNIQTGFQEKAVCINTNGTDVKGLGNVIVACMLADFVLDGFHSNYLSLFNESVVKFGRHVHNICNDQKNSMVKCGKYRQCT